MDMIMCERIVAKTSVRMLLSLLLIFGSVNPATVSYTHLTLPTIA